MQYSDVSQEIVEYLDAYARVTCNEIVNFSPPTPPSLHPISSTSYPYDSSEDEEAVIRYDCSDSDASRSSTASPLMQFDVFQCNEITDAEILSVLLEDDTSPLLPSINSPDTSAEVSDEQSLHNQLMVHFDTKTLDEFLEQLQEIEVDIATDELVNILETDDKNKEKH